jgi:hypothetical protein
MKKIYLLIASVILFVLAKSQTPVSMSSQPGLTYTENFSDIANWTFNGTTGTFSSGVGSAPWRGNPGAAGSGIPTPSVMTTSTLAFSTGSSGGVQKGTGVIQFLTTGTTANTTSLGFDFFMDFTNVNAGTISFNPATVFNSTGDRVGTLRVYASTDGSNWTQLTGANLPYVATNNVAGNALITSIPLPASFNGSPTARLRFYYHNGDANGTAGSRPKISIDDLTVTATNSQNPTPSIVASPTSLTGFSATAGTASLSQSFTASGSNLTDNILISPSSLYEVSLNNSIFSSSVTLNQSGGTVNNTTVYVRIKSSASPGAANGSIALTSGTASNSVSLSGTVIGLINLAASPYVQNFNGIGAGLPSGITVRTGATVSATGTEAAFVTAPTTWSNTAGAFKNFASGNNDQGVSQNTATDRAVGVRQVTGTDQGAAFVFQIANTSGKINFTLDFNLQSLDASSPRITTWRVDYGFGINPSSFVVPTTTGILTTGGNTFSNNPIHVDFGNTLDDQSGVITVRVVTVTPTSGSGNRASTGIDDFTLIWEDPTAKTFSLDATAINFPLTNIGNSTISSYKIVSQTNLDQPIDIVATTPYTVSADNVNFVSNLSVAPGDAFDKSIYVKFEPVAAGVFPGTITHTSNGAGSKIINLSGEAVDPDALTFNFNTCSVSNIPGAGFLSINRTGAQKWKCSQFGRNGTNGADVNGFANGAAQTNDAWLISPALNLNNIVNLAVLSFYSRGEFNGPKLQLYVSTTYDGTSVPDPADWTELNGNFPTPPGTATTTWTFSDNIDLSAYKAAQTVYMAFRYTSTASPASAARWSVDDIAITDQSTLLTVSPIQLNFGEVSVGTNSPGQPVSLTAIGSNDLTVTPPAGYQISTDNSSFTTDPIVIGQSVAAAGTTFYVRFSPVAKALKVEGNINVTATGLDKNVVALTGSSFPKSETFDVACYNISFFGAGSNNDFTPEQRATQVANISTVMQHLNMDVIGIEEMSNDAALGQLVANLPGYDSVVSKRWSYSFEPPDPTFPPQKIGFIYNTATMTLSSEEPPRVMFESLYDSARSNLPNHRLTDYPTGNPSSFWASGRLPFMATFNATIDGVTQKIRIVVIHAKSGGDADGYIRRQYDVKLLKDSLDYYYPTDKVILIGDYNDRMVTSIFAGHPSSYLPYVNDNINYNILTYPLDQAGRTSFPSSNGLIDHVTITNELNNEYISNSTDIEDPRTYIANYNSVTASDHLPVYSRFQFCKLTCPANITVSNDAGQCGAIVNFNVSSISTCGTVTVLPASGSFFPTGTTTVNVTSSSGQSCSFTVTVNDSEDPIISAPTNVTVNVDAGVCYATNVTLGTATTSDNCTGTIIVGNNAPSQFPKGVTTVIWTATDASGNTSTAEQTVTVNDNANPVITSCPVAQVFCVNQSGSYTIPALTATDNCGVVTYSYTILGATTGSGNTNNASGAFSVGVSTIRWIATDGSGNTATCQTTVTINANPAVIIPDAFALSSGTLANTVYIGYSPASSVTLVAAGSGGAPGYNYSWSNGSTSSTTSVSPVVNTTYTVTITDQNNCQASANKQVVVMDIRGGKKLDKVTICHNQSGTPKTMEVSQSETAIHLSHGDMLGACGAASIITKGPGEKETPGNGKLIIVAMPNPSAKGFMLNVTGDASSQLMLRVMDISGRIIETKNVTSNQSVRIGDNYRAGMYFAEVAQGNERKIVKLVKIQ